MARPKAFAPDDALAAALRQFRRKGYAATSVADLVAATGVNRASLYATFGDKHALFLACLDRYAEAESARILDAAGPARETLAHVFSEAIDRGLEDGGAGCFVTNTVAEFGGRDPAVLARARAALARIENALDRLLRQDLTGLAQDRAPDPRTPDPRAPDPRSRARHLLLVLQGLHLLAKVNPDRAALHRGAREAVEAALR